MTFAIAAIIISLVSTGLNVWTARNLRKTNHTQHAISLNQNRMAKLMYHQSTGKEWVEH